MKVVIVEHFQCEACRHLYPTKTSALKCESRTVRRDQVVNVGDTVKILSGEGCGGLASVESVFVVDMNWGHYSWEKYWHTVAVTARLLNETGHRQLTFDAYKVVAP